MVAPRSPEGHLKRWIQLVFWQKCLSLVPPIFPACLSLPTAGFSCYHHRQGPESSTARTAGVRGGPVIAASWGLKRMRAHGWFNLNSFLPQSAFLSCLPSPLRFRHVFSQLKKPGFSPGQEACVAVTEDGLMPSLVRFLPTGAEATGLRHPPLLSLFPVDISTGPAWLNQGLLLNSTQSVSSLDLTTGAALSQSRYVCFRVRKASHGARPLLGGRQPVPARLWQSAGGTSFPPRSVPGC